MRDVFIPVLGMAPDDVTLVSWLCAPGDAIEAGQAIAVIETSKAQMELESESAGTLGPHLYPEGATIAPGATITHVLAAGEQAPVISGPVSQTSEGHVVATNGSVQAAGSQPGATDPAGTARSPHTASPRARRIAAEAALAAAPGDTTTQSVVAAVSPPPSPAGVQENGRRQSARAAIARAVSRSWSEVPHFAVSRELHVGDLAETTAQWRAVLPRLTVTDLLLRVLALAMVDTMGSSGVDLGLAVATDAGVVIPVIRRVPELGLPDLVGARIAAVARARDGRMHIDDATVPATTLSNLGALGVDHFTGVIPHGGTSLVTVGRAAQRPVVTNGVLAVATTMWATVNLDHRVYDGIYGARLLERLAVIASAPTLFFGGGAPLPPPSSSIPPPVAEGPDR